jgi:hypothetical protein
MSSVTRFIRQIPVSTTYYDAASILNNQNNAFAFVPTPANYVGNYTPGVMYQATQASTNQAGKALQAAILAAIAGNGGVGALVGNAANFLVLRDMGKTIKAVYETTAGDAPRSAVTDGNEGFFREVQLIAPRPLGPTSNTVIGGPTGSTFGVIGNTPEYLTFYIPVAVAGVRGAPSAPVYAIAGGQM